MKQDALLPCNRSDLTEDLKSIPGDSLLHAANPCCADDQQSSLVFLKRLAL
jgi:hypothetical protein